MSPPQATALLREGRARVGTWWRGRSPRARSLWGGGLAVVVTGVVAVVVGVPTAGTDGSLGPHRATYEVTTDHEVRVNLGPLGSLALDSPLPWPVGVEVLVQEIPAGLSTTGANPALALVDDLEGYLQFFARPELAVQGAVDALVVDVLGRTVLLWSTLLVLVAAGRLASREGALRVQVRASLARPGVGTLLGAVAAVAVVVPSVLTAGSAEPPGRRSIVLAGTPLAQARIVGRLGELVDTYGGMALDAIEENRDFYDTAAANLTDAYATDPAPLEPGPGSIAGRGPGPASDEVPSSSASPSGTVPPVTAAADTGVAAVPSPGPTGDPSDVATFLLVSDLHCNVGMAAVVGEAARLAAAQAVLDAGDTVIAGTSVEEFCVNALAEAIDPEVPLVVADGNHDSEETAAQERRAGAIVLEGEPVVVAGVRILGDAEPTLTTVTEGTRLKGDETRTEMARRLAARACEAVDAGEQVDILMVHNPRAGVAPMASGCLPLQLSGHMHRQIGPTPQGLGLLYGSASTGGATLGGQTIGPLQAPGVMTVLRFDAVAHRPLAYRLLTIGTDASADVGPWLPFPEPSSTPVVADLTGEVAAY